MQIAANTCGNCVALHGGVGLVCHHHYPWLNLYTGFQLPINSYSNCSLVHTVLFQDISCLIWQVSCVIFYIHRQLRSSVSHQPCAFSGAGRKICRELPIALKSSEIIAAYRKTYFFELHFHPKSLAVPRSDDDFGLLSL